MKRILFTCFGCVAYVMAMGPATLGGCESAPRQDQGAESSEQAEPVTVAEPTFGPGVVEIRGVMQAKLVHAHAILDAVTTGNMASVEQHAEALTALSRESDWQVHTTMAYGVFSDQFRQVSGDLAAHARAGSASAVTADYARLTAACMECHDYLRREGLLKDLPGVISNASEEGEIPLLAACLGQR